jgi:hypothetical protein
MTNNYRGRSHDLSALNDLDSCSEQTKELADYKAAQEAEMIVNKYKSLRCCPRIGGNRRWRYLRLELKAKTAVGSRRRRQRHDDRYHGSRFGASAG